MHRAIEELALNAWPALRTYAYDGWLLRFADGYTKRANSVSPIYEGQIHDLNEKIEHCERMYEESGISPVFKMTPFVPDRELDGLLEAKGYRMADASSVRILEDLSHAAEPRNPNVVVEETLSETWLSLAASWIGLSPQQVETTRKMLGQSQLLQGFFALHNEGVPVACGIGVIENGFVGLYDIITHPEHRGRGHAMQLILHVLRWARAHGASRSYLLVVQGNAPANRLYDKLGYKEIYPYWYRVKDT